MKRNALLTWVLISIMFDSVACLPFDHTCIVGPVGSKLDSEVKPDDATNLTATHTFARENPGLRERVRPGKSDVCPACLYSRTLLRTDSTSEVAVVRRVAAAPVCTQVLLYQLTDFLQSTFKRGPPVARLS